MKSSAFNRIGLGFFLVTCLSYGALATAGESDWVGTSYGPNEPEALCSNGYKLAGFELSRRPGLGSGVGIRGLCRKFNNATGRWLVPKRRATSRIGTKGIGKKSVTCPAHYWVGGVTATRRGNGASLKFINIKIECYRANNAHEREGQPRLRESGSAGSSAGTFRRCPGDEIANGLSANHSNNHIRAFNLHCSATQGNPNPPQTPPPSTNVSFGDLFNQPFNSKSAEGRLTYKNPRCITCHGVNAAKSTKANHNVNSNCSNCHQVPNWHAPDASMDFRGKSTNDLCQMTRDFGSAQEVLHHLTDDPPVNWALGTDSPTGSSAPSNAEWNDRAQQWVSAGMPCP